MDRGGEGNLSSCSPTRSSPPYWPPSLPPFILQGAHYLPTLSLLSSGPSLLIPPSPCLPPFCRALIVGLDEAKWAGTYKFAQAVLEYYDKVCSLLSSSPNAL